MIQPVAEPIFTTRSDPCKITGKERDSESGLDDFGARYYSSAMGRFASPDEPLVDQSPNNPQTWNLYTYGRNNPLNGIDPDGRGWWDDFWQKAGNLLKYGHAVTNADLNAALAKDAQTHITYLTNQGVLIGGFKPSEYFAGMSNQQIVDQSRQYEDQLAGGQTSMSLIFTYDALQHIYDKHSGDFGVSGNKNKEQLDALKERIDEHIGDPNTTKITGEYHGQPAEMYYNSQTKNVVITDGSGNLITGFRLSPAQVGHLTTTGRLN